jgi:heme oxygenase
MLPLLDPRVTVQQLRGVIRALYGFYAPLEGRIERAAGEPLRGEVQRRQKTPSLMNDLLALGDTVEAISQLPY